MKKMLLAALASCAALAQAQDQVSPQLLSAAHRRPANVARDGFRHPIEVLRFFGVKENSTVVEVLPGSGGYYMEILAPFLRERGRYIGADRDDTALPQYLADRERLLARLKAEPALYGKVVVTKFNVEGRDIAPAGSADFVITFRNLHNWIERREIDGALRAFHRALKPGGVLGVVDHRGRTDRIQEAQMKSGYVREDYAVAVIEEAGFKLAGASGVNANPRDTKDHPEGVWTLPPTYRLKDQDRAKYQAIGESDRFTLRFVKRAGADRIAEARYASPVERYGHFALGKPHEYARLTATTDSGRKLELRLPENEVFEDLAPRLVRLAAGEPAEILTIVSRRDSGSRLVMVRLSNEGLAISAQSPAIGAPMRWLNPVGVADLDGDGRAEIAAVITPHLGGTLKVYRRSGGDLVEMASLGGFSNHVYGSAELALSAPVSIAGRTQLLVPDATRLHLRIIALEGGRLVETGRCKLAAPVTGAIEPIVPRDCLR